MVNNSFLMSYSNVVSFVIMGGRGIPSTRVLICQENAVRYGMLIISILLKLLPMPKI